ncbi:hypothetical protein PIROE2DRAFT_11476 [Piromyces sp. E2]|nr:hypothetical protein PIROE2DRAFT_11476 [Piromyces sp. E2]|eukprot:OUM62278.1 hypothetical protein PIROE2DRAFT_11476 [Piromyces sp. E2]
MLLKYIIALSSCICGISAVSDFIKKGNRPELFELTDNEVATFRVTIPTEEFDGMKKSLNIGPPDVGILNFTDVITMSKTVGTYLVDGLIKTNYTLLSPDLPLKTVLPQLKIGDDGMSQLKFEEVIGGFRFDPEYYVDIKDRFLYLQCLQSNPDVNLYEIILTLVGLNLVGSPNFLVADFIKEMISSIADTMYEYKTKESSLVVELNK